MRNLIGTLQTLKDIQDECQNCIKLKKEIDELKIKNLALQEQVDQTTPSTSTEVRPSTPTGVRPCSTPSEVRTSTRTAVRTSTRTEVRPSTSTQAKDGLQGILYCVSCSAQSRSPTNL